MDINTYKKIKTEFIKNFKEKVLPTLKRHDGERKKKLLKAKIIAIPITIVAFPLLAYIQYTQIVNKSTDPRITVVLIASLCVYPIVKGIIKKNFENKMKRIIMPKICKCFNLKWSNGSYGNDNLLQKTKLFDYSNRSYYDDIFKGKYKDVELEIIEALFEEVRNSGKNRTVIKKFEGAIVRIKMNKKFNTHTVIRPDTMFHCTPDANLRHTKLEDPVFENRFDVFTDDEVEARYLITTSFMERLTGIQRIFNASKVSCAFYNNELFIGLYTSKDLFSLFSLDKSTEDYEQFEIFYEEIISIYKIIDYFKLNEKIGL